MNPIFSSGPFISLEHLPLCSLRPSLSLDRLKDCVADQLTDYYIAGPEEFKRTNLARSFSTILQFLELLYLTTMDAIKQRFRTRTADGQGRPLSIASRTSSKASSGKISDIRLTEPEELGQQERDKAALSWLGGGGNHESFMQALKRVQDENARRQKHTDMLSGKMTDFFSRFVNKEQFSEEQRSVAVALQEDLLRGVDDMANAAEASQLGDLFRMKDLLDSIYDAHLRAHSSPRSASPRSEVDTDYLQNAQEQVSRKDSADRPGSYDRPTTQARVASAPRAMSTLSENDSLPDSRVDQKKTGIWTEELPHTTGVADQPTELAASSQAGEPMNTPESSDEVPGVFQGLSRWQQAPIRDSSRGLDDAIEQHPPTQRWLGEPRDPIIPLAHEDAVSRGWPQDVQNRPASQTEATTLQSFSESQDEHQATPSQSTRSPERLPDRSEIIPQEVETPAQARIQRPPLAVLARSSSRMIGELPGFDSMALSTFKESSAPRQRRQPTRKPELKIRFEELRPGPALPHDLTPVPSPESASLDVNKLKSYQQLLESEDIEDRAGSAAVLAPSEDARGAKEMGHDESVTAKDGLQCQSGVATFKTRKTAVQANPTADARVLNESHLAPGPLDAPPGSKSLPTPRQSPRRTASDYVGSRIGIPGSALIISCGGFLRRHQEAWAELIWLIITFLYAQILNTLRVALGFAENVCGHCGIWIANSLPDAVILDLSPRARMDLASDVLLLSFGVFIEANNFRTREVKMWREANGLTRMYYLDALREDTAWVQLP